MTMGPALLVMAWLDARRLRPTHPLVVIGRVPMFYYVIESLSEKFSGSRHAVPATGGGAPAPAAPHAKRED